MAGFIQCNYGGGGGPVEVIKGSVTGETGGTLTITSQQGKAPKNVSICRTDGTQAQMFWNYTYPGAAAVRLYNNTASSLNVGTASTAVCTMASVGADSVTIKYPTNATYAQKPFTYSVEFE